MGGPTQWRGPTNGCPPLASRHSLLRLPVGPPTATQAGTQGRQVQTQLEFLRPLTPLLFPKQSRLGVKVRWPGCSLRRAIAVIPVGSQDQASPCLFANGCQLLQLSLEASPTRLCTRLLGKGIAQTHCTAHSPGPANRLPPAAELLPCPLFHCGGTCTAPTGLARKPSPATPAATATGHLLPYCSAFPS